MKTRISIILGFFLLVLTACEKEEFSIDKNQPVFTADIPFVTGDDLSINAGDELYYMYSSHQETETELIYTGLFGKDESCEENCGENFAIKIHQKNGSQAKLETGKYEFFSIPKEGYKHDYTLLTDDEDALEKSTWRVGNQTHFGESLSVNFDNDTAPGEGVRLIHDEPGQFVVQFDRLILPNEVECDIELKIERVVNEGIFLEIVTSSPYSFISWSTGEVGKRIEVDFSSQIYTVKVYDGSGCATDIIINFKTQNISDDYSIGFSQNSYGFATPDNADNSVSISYTDSDGVFYTSSIIGQILPFDFDVLEVSDYENNENDEPTWMIKSKFDCILFGDNGKTKRIKDGNAIFAVSY